MNRIKNLQGCFKNKQTNKEIEFHNSLKIEFLQPFTRCRKVFGKRLDLCPDKRRTHGTCIPSLSPKFSALPASCMALSIGLARRK